MLYLTHQTKQHDFYMGWAVNTQYQQRIILYNIIPKGHKRPTSGYYQPKSIMILRGYEHLKVYEVFPNDVPTEDITL